MPPVACPSKDQLLALRKGTMPPPMRQQVIEHVATCRTCATALQRLSTQTGASSEAQPSSKPEKTLTGFRRSDAEEPAVANGASDPAAPPVHATAAQFAFLSAPQAQGDLGRLEHYRVVQLLGEGGMGLVFRGFDLQLKRPVALKVIKPQVSAEPNANKRLLSEARAMAAVASDHIVTIYHVGRPNGVLYLAMELLVGESLEQRLAPRTWRPTPKEVADLAKQAATGLAAAHERGLIHRDIKPSNIWINPAGRVKLLDFGLARAVHYDSRLTQEGYIVGTPQYMSPEQIEGARELDARSDLFSLGSVLYEICAGQFAFTGSSPVAVMHKIATAPAQPLQELCPNLPRSLADIIMRMLAKRPDERFASAREVIEALTRVEGELASGTLAIERVAVADATDKVAAPEGSQKSKRKKRKASKTVPVEAPRHGLPLASAAMFFVGIAALSFGVLAWMNSSERSTDPTHHSASVDAKVELTLAPEPMPGQFPLPAALPVALPKSEESSFPPSKTGETKQGPQAGALALAPSKDQITKPEPPTDPKAPPPKDDGSLGKDGPPPRPDGPTGKDSRARAGAGEMPFPPPFGEGGFRPPPPPNEFGPPGKDEQGKQDNDRIHYLVSNGSRIKRSVKRLSNGVETLTEARDARDREMIKYIQDHVAAMNKRMTEGRELMTLDPQMAANIAYGKLIKLTVDTTKKGVKVRETSDDPEMVQRIQQHADEITTFVEQGPPHERGGPSGRGGPPGPFGERGRPEDGGRPGFPPKKKFGQ